MTVERVSSCIAEAALVTLSCDDEDTKNYSNDKNFELASIALTDYLKSAKFIKQNCKVCLPIMGKSLRYTIKCKGGSGNVYPRNYLNMAGDDVVCANDMEVYAITSNTAFKFPSSTATTVQKSKNGLDYSDIGGLSKQIEIIREMIETPLHSPEIYRDFGLEPPKGILMYGPPGTGKTLIARVVANQTGAFFSVINGAELMSQYVGETETRLKEVFDEARENAPAVIFIDELDSICSKRDESSSSQTEKRVVGTLLTLMDGVSSKANDNSKSIVVLAATNRPDSIDQALRRAGL